MSLGDQFETIGLALLGEAAGRLRLRFRRAPYAYIWLRANQTHRFHVGAVVGLN